MAIVQRAKAVQPAGARRLDFAGQVARQSSLATRKLREAEKERKSGGLGYKSLLISRPYPSPPSSELANLQHQVPPQVLAHEDGKIARLKFIMTGLLIVEITRGEYFLHFCTEPGIGAGSSRVGWLGTRHGLASSSTSSTSPLPPFSPSYPSPSSSSSSSTSIGCV